MSHFPDLMHKKKLLIKVETSFKCKVWQHQRSKNSICSFGVTDFTFKNVSNCFLVKNPFEIDLCAVACLLLSKLQMVMMLNIFVKSLRNVLLI